MAHGPLDSDEPSIDSWPELKEGSCDDSKVVVAFSREELLREEARRAAKLEIPIHCGIAKDHGPDEPSGCDGASCPREGSASVTGSGTVDGGAPSRTRNDHGSGGQALEAGPTRPQDTADS